MKFPYGLADFYSIRKEGYFYQDRTHFIRTLEERGKQLIFLRPRRFGKSVWLSTLANYYDVARASDFALLFGDLAIGQNPTPLHNQYLILRWDFSKVAAYDNVEDIAQRLYNVINQEIINFEERYQAWLPRTIEINPTDAVASFNNLLSAVNLAGYPLYLLLDEYDNFANEIAMGGTHNDAERYLAMASGDGLLKTVFKNLKAAMGEGRLDRLFVTGVSPMLLGDLTSGFNTAVDISLEAQVHDLCGFSEAEVVKLAQQVGGDCDFAVEQITQMIELMRVFYNGYTFLPDASSALYNPTLTLYFLSKVQLERKPPQKLLDVNLTMDRNKLAYIASRPGGEALILRLMEDDPPMGVRAIYDRFSLTDLAQPVQESEHLASLLFYFGLVSAAGYTATGKLHLQIPNLVTHGLYYEQLRLLLLPDVLRRNQSTEVAELLYSEGQMQPLCDFMAERVYRAFSNRDYRHANELTVKALFLALLYNDLIYITDSEPELERRYADLLMLLRPNQRVYQLFDLLIEFKYVELSSVHLNAEGVRSKTDAELVELEKINAAFTEASSALEDYRRTLTSKYGQLLKLRVYTVVSLGFERILWQEVK